VVVAVTWSLGVWQLGRAQQKLALQAERERQMTLPPLVLGPGVPPEPQDAQRQAVVTGEWLPQASVFLENRQHKGQPGFWLVTPLRVSVTSPQADLLVVRGWAPRDIRERTLVPQVPTPAGPVQVQGRLGPPPAALAALGSGVVETGTVRLNLDVPAYAAQFQLKPWPLVLWQAEGAATVRAVQAKPVSVADGLVRDWPMPAFKVDMHHGYAAQWFGLGLAAIGLMLWHQRKRKTSPPSP
jgi:surfeit locus 1 family protein